MTVHYGNPCNGYAKKRPEYIYVVGNPSTTIEGYFITDKLYEFPSDKLSLTSLSSVIYFHQESTCLESRSISCHRYVEQSSFFFVSACDKILIILPGL
jgi:hypothetical protein